MQSTAAASTSITGFVSGIEAQTPPRGASVVARDLRRVFPGSIVALDGVSLTLANGEFVMLTGPSGSGKTTLLSIIGGLDEPTSGTVEVDGKPLETWRANGFHRVVVGFVFQHHYLLAHLPARVNVEIPLIGAGLGQAERRARADALLTEVGLAHRQDALAGILSGGERQRVAVARALANDPRLLLADEPTGALDTEDTERVIELLEESRQRRGMTLMVVSHDDVIGRHADRTLHLRDGRLVPEPSRAGLAAQQPRG
jgi:ABC-type lipoprotein export system ATPase subunit